MKSTWFQVVMLLAVTSCTPGPEMSSVAIGKDLSFVVEVARDRDELSDGLAGRSALDSDGMIFVFDEPASQEVWMAGMELPLDVAWIADGEVVEIRTLGPCRAADPQECSRWKSPDVVDALLEVGAGELATVRVGTRVTTTPIGGDS